MLEHVALGRAICTAPKSVAELYHRTDIRFIPLTGVEPSIVAVATPSRRRPEVDTLLEHAIDVYRK